jgi:hypothetical protein
MTTMKKIRSELRQFIKTVRWLQMQIVLLNSPMVLQVIEADFSKMLETSTAFKKDKNIKKNSFV